MFLGDRTFSCTLPSPTPLTSTVLPKTNQSCVTGGCSQSTAPDLACNPLAIQPPKSGTRFPLSFAASVHSQHSSCIFVIRVLARAKSKGGGRAKRKSSIYNSLVIRIIHDKLKNTLDSESSPVLSIFLDKSQGESSMSTVLLDCAQVGQTPAPRAATEITVG